MPPTCMHMTPVRLSRLCLGRWRQSVPSTYTGLGCTTHGSPRARALNAIGQSWVTLSLQMPVPLPLGQDLRLSSSLRLQISRTGGTAAGTADHLQDLQRCDGGREGGDELVLPAVPPARQGAERGACRAYMFASRSHANGSRIDGSYGHVSPELLEHSHDAAWISEYSSG